MRQQWHRHPKTLRVGIKPDVPERYGELAPGPGPTEVVNCDSPGGGGGGGAGLGAEAGAVAGTGAGVGPGAVGGRGETGAFDQNSSFMSPNNLSLKK